MEITKKDIIQAVKSAGLQKKCVCVHASLKSFGGVKDGAKTVVDALVESGCTVMVPTFSFSYMVMPPVEMKFPHNGADYSRLDRIIQGSKAVYTPESNTLDLHDMGRIPEEVLSRKGRIRGRHPLCSFSAIGPFAAELIKGQRPMDVYAPLRELALFEGYVVLMGVGLNKMTAIHLAEQMAGRKMFIRWAIGQDKRVITAECGGCSDGFEKLAPYAAAAEKKVKCGDSIWRIFETGKLLKNTARAIMLQTEITRCGKQDCTRCDDMIKGGPALSA